MNTIVLDLPENYQLGTFEIRNGHYITFEEYLKIDIEGALTEWVDGKVIAFMSNNLLHQRVSSFLEMVMKLFVETHSLGEIIRAGYPMKLEVQKRGREPDVFFVGKDNAHRLGHTFLDGAADIAVEIVSPESVERDTEEKFGEYEKAGVGEYWLIDPAKKRAEFYILDANQKYNRAETTDGIFRSQVLEGFFLRESWLWLEQPPTLEALRELGLL